MAAEITQIDPQSFTSQTYEGNDISLLSSFDVNTSLSSSSYIELFIYDNNQNLLSSDLNFTQYTIQNDGQSAGNEGNISEIILDPEKILLDNGFDQGEYITYFNFLDHQIGSDIELLYIAEISSDRTEIRLDSTSLTNEDIVEKTLSFIQERENSPYFLDFYLDFGDNQLSIANNIQLDNTDPNNPTILVKLYEALPEEFSINSTLWVVTSVEEPRAYKVTFEDIPIIISDTVSLKGPNFNLDLKDQVNNSTLALSYEDLIYTPLSSSQNQLNSLLEEKEIDINIDYTNFSDFIHFSSAKTRIENFYYKVSLIEQYSSSIAILNTTTNNNPSSSIAIYESKINDIITNFDGYDYYLYYSSGSWAYPKLNNEPPYQLYSTTNPATLSWLGSDDPDDPYYGGIILSASMYDGENQNNLYFVIPEYLREDSSNDPYLLFIDMVGQHYDNIWVYYKDVTQKYNADNRLESGISKDIVADAIRDFGVKLYQNNFSNDDLFTAFLGLTPDGALFPFPNITGSLPTPSGFEYVDTLISASNDYLPLDDVNKSLYKRIYHNLPYLLKSKGTLPGLRALITSYGIPDTILRINEYGGKDKVDSNDWDYWQNEFNYAFNTDGSNHFYTLFKLNTNWNSPNNVPASIEFRFKPGEFPPTNATQSLLTIKSSPTNISSQLTLEYVGSGSISGSYSGSITDPYNQYAYLKYYPSASLGVTASVYLPFFNGDWWSVLLTSGSNGFTLYSKNKPSTEYPFTNVQFQASSSLTSSYDGWVVGTRAHFASGSNPTFSGSLQEVRYYTKVISQDTFDGYVMNPYSIEESEYLAFRGSLGGELYTEANSIHPKSTGSWITTQSFQTNNGNYSYDTNPTFDFNTEYFFYDQPIAGIKNTVSDKIRIEGNTLPTGSTLSPFRRLEQVIEASSSYTPNINYLEVAFSPQNEINEDIMDQLGFFNIGDYIGNPSERFSGNSYPDLDNLRNTYFEKYIKNYDLVDFIRLIKFFDNSLFKMIRDFVPARTSLASGIVIKQHLLERNKYPQPQMEWENLDISGTLKPTWNDYNPGTVENFEGGTGGSFESFNYVGNISQSWNETFTTPLGEVTVLHDSQEEFYDGEFSGSIILVTTQSLNQAYPLENASFEYAPILYRNGLYGTALTSTFTEAQFLNPLTTPSSGEMLILAPRNLPTTFFGGAKGKGSAYIKIHKIDCNGVDNTIPLGQLTQLLVQYTTSPTYKTYQVLNINEHSTYYLYEINNQPISATGTGIDNEIKNYLTSASNIAFASITPTPTTYILYGNTLGNSLGYFDSSSGVFTLNDTPNIPLSITASTVIDGGNGKFDIALSRQGTISVLESTTTTPGNLFSISSSYFGLKGDQIYLRASKGSGSPVAVSGSFLITQSIAPTASVCDSVILEPYITTPNFYNSDENALLNSIENERLSTIYQDVDYSTGISTPTNFGLIITGSATKASVQDSNYTTKRHILPRYDGSKSTSQQLNVWNPSDTGTYGKLPTIELTQDVVAYCDWIGGYPPERMDTSGAHVKYFIYPDGTARPSSLTDTSFYDNKNAFNTGERLIISLGDNSVSNPSIENPYRTIIRGATSIEPILYTQYGHSPAEFMGEVGTNITMSFTTNFVSSQASVDDYQASANPSVASVTVSSTNYGITNFLNVIYTGSSGTWTGSQYNVIQSSIDENVTLTFTANIKNISITTSANSATANGYISFRIVRQRGADITPLSTYNIPFNSTVIPFGVSYWGDITLTVNLSSQEVLASDKIYIQGYSNLSSAYTTRFSGTNSSYVVSQSPIPTDVVVTGSSTLENTIWGYPTANTSIITASGGPGSPLNLLYGKNFKQVDIQGSGFNAISLPWGLKIGDEFRFEGNESSTFVVKNVYSPEDASLERVSPTGSLEVHFNVSLPSSSINLDHFLVRRYVDNNSIILFEGFKPPNTQGPYLIKPEFISPEFDSNLSKIIADLTNKGLL